ncbi:MAG TPA: AAA family ATPase [Firmicutes bacterium]|mgnify:CR=1 FL=1|nr:AAA family ATPase [Bacillota bacterium]
MRYQENSTVKLERELTDGIKKQVIAFANSNGGTIFIGIEKNGKVIGVTDPDEVSTQVSNMIRDGIKPDATTLTEYNVESINGKDVVRIDVQKGTRNPYYLVTEGLCPSGVFVRKGKSTSAASNSVIRRMIKRTDGNVFEEMRSLNQDLTFNTTAAEFKKRNLDFTESQMKDLGLISPDNIYTNLGYLLSDQCDHTIKVAVFSGKTKSIFKDRREFAGPLLKQFKDVSAYLSPLNKTREEFSSLSHAEGKDYPEEALREALLNSIVHRDYSYSASTLISIFDNRIELVSMGGLAKRINLKDIKLGISLSRNEKLKEVFSRLKLIEAHGTGIQKILNSYEHCSNKPEVKVSGNAFLLMLPNMNAEAMAKTLTENEQAVLGLFADNEAIARKDVEALLSVSQTMAGRIVRQLVRKGLLSVVGHGMNTKYVLNK